MSALTLIQQAQQQQHNNNNNNVSVIQVCVSELTAHRALILYNVYVAVLLVAVDVDSVLFVDQQQLAQYAHFLRQESFLCCSV
jgi:hypothetical protein